MAQILHSVELIDKCFYFYSIFRIILIISCFFLSLSLSKDDPWTVLACENAKDLLIWKLSNYDGRMSWRTFFIAHLSMLVISPLHHVVYVETSDAVTSTTGHLVCLNLLHFLSSFQNKIRKSLDFCYVSYVSDLAYTELTFEIRAYWKNFKRLIESIFCKNDSKFFSSFYIKNLTVI